MIITIMTTIFYDTIKCYKYFTLNANEVNVAPLAPRSHLHAGKTCSDYVGLITGKCLGIPTLCNIVRTHKTETIAAHLLRLCTIVHHGQVAQTKEVCGLWHAPGRS